MDRTCVRTSHVPIGMHSTCCCTRLARRPLRVLAYESNASSSRCGAAAQTTRIGRRAALYSVLLAAQVALYAQDGKASTKQEVISNLAAAELDGGVTKLYPLASASELAASGRQILEFNRRIQKQNNAPADFPAFVREAYDIKILADGYSNEPSGLIYKEFEEGTGDQPQDGQEVTFHYTAYNESGARIDSSYNKGQPANIRLGVNGLIPGFELGIKGMRVGGKRRLVVSPELGPPVGPATFFSAKQCEVFDVELLGIKNCRQQRLAMFSKVVCE